MAGKLIIIPAYNEEKNILRTIEVIQKDAPDFDYVVINDCSTDCTGVLLEEKGINHLTLPVNLGIGGAVQTGYQYAQQHDYDIAVQMDGDGQHVPAYLDRMSKILEQGQADMVIGSRFIEKAGFQSSGFRRLGIRYFSWLVKLCTGKRITDPTSGQRMIGKRVIAEFAEDYPKDYPEPETIVSILRKGYEVKEIPVMMKEREGGKSSIGLLNSMYYMIKVSLAVLLETTRGRKQHG